MRLTGGKVGDELRFGAVGFDIGRQPADAVIVADHDLEAAPAVIERAGELRHELRRDVVLVKHGERVELAAGDIRGRVRRKRRGVDRDRKAGLLHQPRRRQAHHAGADHRDRPAVALQAELGRELRRAPAQRDAGAAMAVIVDQPLVAELLRPDDEALAPVGPQAGDGADHPAGVDLHRRERRAVRYAARPCADRRAARQQSGGTGGEGSAVENSTRPSLTALRLRLQSSRRSAGRW